MHLLISYVFYRYSISMLLIPQYNMNNPSWFGESSIQYLHLPTLNDWKHESVQVCVQILKAVQCRVVATILLENVDAKSVPVKDHCQLYDSNVLEYFEILDLKM